jgi:[ribosomal protein S18]-alanine N-acetyltransferase
VSERSEGGLARPMERGARHTVDDRDSGGDAYPVTIRGMRVSDLDAVMQIEYVAFTMPWSSLTYRNLLRRRDADLYVAESPEDGVVGYAALWGVLDEGELGTLAVEPRRRNRGVARRLLERVLQRGRERGMRAIFLEVRVSNTPAQRLYAGYDFQQVGVRRNYYAFPLEDALVLRRAIERMVDGEAR